MVFIRWALAALLTVVFFLIGGFIIETVFLGLIKVTEIAGGSSEGSPSYLVITVKRVFGFLFGSALAVYAVLRLVKELNPSLYLKVFMWAVISVQTLTVLFFIVQIGFSAALIWLIVPIFECFGALLGASYGFSLALIKEKDPEISNS